MRELDEMDGRIQGMVEARKLLTDEARSAAHSLHYYKHLERPMDTPHWRHAQRMQWMYGCVYRRLQNLIFALRIRIRDARRELEDAAADTAADMQIEAALIEKATNPRG